MNMPDTAPETAPDSVRTTVLTGPPEGGVGLRFLRFLRLFWGQSPGGLSGFSSCGDLGHDRGRTRLRIIVDDENPRIRLVGELTDLGQQ